jgi:hypothetical protein
MPENSNGNPLDLKLKATQFLKATGLLDGYEAVIQELITNGWPSDKSIFDHAAYEILKFHADHKEEYLTKKIENPGVNALLKKKDPTTAPEA